MELHRGGHTGHHPGLRTAAPRGPAATLVSWLVGRPAGSSTSDCSAGWPFAPRQGGATTGHVRPPDAWWPSWPSPPPGRPRGR
ncbi:hypothetical protein [Ornithinimicrobium kibberense]|uniref:hypothetical protein n=1 Tax=Ornithinimicrobium kibberense TaxID=282060 RepID=UPI00361C6296